MQRVPDAEGSVFGVQARIPHEQVTIEGQSTKWTRPSDSGGPVTFHFCPECGSTVYTHELDGLLRKRPCSIPQEPALSMQST
jgi:hypothetical protein